MNLITGISLLLALFNLPAFSQQRIECRGLGSLKTQKTTISINNKVQNDSISKKALVNGLSVLLTDPSFKVIGFVIGYDCHSKSMIKDFHERTFYGNNIKANDPFLKGVWKGDMLSIDCINISKKGKRYIAEPRLFRVTD